MGKVELSKFGVLRDSRSKYLYRGLRKEEVDAGMILVPKGIQTFEDLKLITANAGGFYEPRNLGPILRVSRHIEGDKSSGVSTSTNREVAISYALSSPPGKQYVVVINREKARLLGIREIVVKEILPLWVIQKPDDEEVILVSDTGVFPKEIIERVDKIKEKAN